jgi:lysophospholipase L1-like esterase
VIRSHARYRLFFLALTVFVVCCFCFSPPRQGVVILCAGDSITASEYPRDLERLLARDGIRAKVLNYGRKGNTSGEYLRFIEERKSSLAGERPDFILIELGTNDVRLDGDKVETPAFARNMRAIIGIFREFSNRTGRNSVILLASIPPVPETVGFPFGPASRDRITREINPLIRDIAREERLVFVDNYALFSGAPELLPEVHPSRDGYRRLARNWYDALKPLLQK